MSWVDKIVKQADEIASGGLPEIECREFKAVCGYRLARDALEENDVAGSKVYRKQATRHQLIAHTARRALHAPNN